MGPHMFLNFSVHYLQMVFRGTSIFSTEIKGLSDLTLQNVGHPIVILVQSYNKTSKSLLEP